MWLKGWGRARCREFSKTAAVPVPVVLETVEALLQTLEADLSFDIRVPVEGDSERSEMFV